MIVSQLQSLLSDGRYKQFRLTIGFDYQAIIDLKQVLHH